MPNVSRARVARALAAAALVGAALTLSACVSDSSGSAFSAPVPSPTAGVTAPTVPAVPTVPPIPRNKPAAVVAGTPISGAAYADTVAAVRKAAAAQQTQQQPTEQQIRSIALNNLIDRAVIRLYARRHGITVTPTEVQSLFDQYQAYYGGPISFTNTLKDNGLTVASFKAQLPDRMLQGKVEQRVAPLPATVEEVDARHILVKSRTLADTLYAQLKRDPHKFAALARKYSIDTQSAQAGGELGFFARGAMVAAFERAAFSQRVGVIGKPVKSTYGYHIILVEAHKNVPVAQAGQQMQQTLQQRQQNAFTQWLSAERRRDDVRILAKGV